MKIKNFINKIKNMNKDKELENVFKENGMWSSGYNYYVFASRIYNVSWFMLADMFIPITKGTYFINFTKEIIYIKKTSEKDDNTKINIPINNIVKIKIKPSRLFLGHKIYIEAIDDNNVNIKMVFNFTNFVLPIKKHTENVKSIVKIIKEINNKLKKREKKEK